MSTFIEHRICGESVNRGPWEGRWRKGDPDIHGEQLHDLIKRNEKLWIERRHVTISDVWREDVKFLTWTLPPSDLLARSETTSAPPDYAADLLEKLAELGATSNVASVSVAPQAVRYLLEPCAGIRPRNFRGLEEDLMMALGVGAIKIEAPYIGTRLVSVEIPREARGTVTLGDVAQFASAPLSAAVGIGIDGLPVTLELNSYPHLLIAGRSGGGKSSLIHSLLCSLLQHVTPTDLELILIDVKRTELSEYADLPHCSNIIYDAAEAIDVLWGMVDTMQATYDAMHEYGVRTLDELNAKLVVEGEQPVRRRLCVVDELGDLMMQGKGKVESAVVRLGQLGRAAGMHLVLATQSPRVQICSGLIRANMVAKIALSTSSALDSRIILDSNGAEDLLGKGDALLDNGSSGYLRRFQVAWCSPKDVQKTVSHWTNQTEIATMEMASCVAY